MGLLKAGLSAATVGASGVVSWLVGHWRLVLTLAAALTLWISFKTVLHERDTARATVAADATTIKTLTAQKDALQANITHLTGEIGAQNASIDGLRAATDKARQDASAAVLAAAKLHEKDAAAIADLRKRGADQSNLGSCDAEISRIRAGL